MNNKQLSIVLLNIITQLEMAISFATKSLQDTDAPFETEEEYIGENIFHLACTTKNPKDYKTIKTTPIALNGIMVIIDNLYAQVGLLKGDEK